MYIEAAGVYKCVYNIHGKNPKKKRCIKCKNMFNIYKGFHNEKRANIT